eukprot:TRINITY_DN44_c0_g2_i10.p3 TRINITY_DN44_c0_g2~~TRINITY_DN44_c0_g2_i10.p3  ORF type:complete len:136 (+),score=17.93 TRINITY_DN44_c0_g2_i10:523-930(+)
MGDVTYTIATPPIQKPRRPQVTGGYQTQNPEEFQNNEQFFGDINALLPIVQEQIKEINTNDLVLDRIIGVRSQVVAGFNYQVTIALQRLSRRNWGNKSFATVRLNLSQGLQDSSPQLVGATFVRWSRNRPQLIFP